jgi:hypothetical protein
MNTHHPLSRKDVLSVVKELDSKSLADPIGKMYKRLEKHFASSSEDQVPSLLFYPLHSPFFALVFSIRRYSLLSHRFYLASS